MGQKFTCYQMLIEGIAFKLFNLGQMFQIDFLPHASLNKLGEFWPIPPDRAGVTVRFEIIGVK